MNELTKTNQTSTLVLSLLFVVLYGSGFVGAKLGFPYAKPLVFLTWRFAISTALLLVIALFVGAQWPRSMKELLHTAIAGIFLVCTFSVGTWISMDMGVPPAISALIIALQPLVVAMGARFVFQKKIGLKQWAGLMLGLMGVILVVGEKVSFDKHYLEGVFMSFLGLFGLAVGNLYQKRYCAYMNIFTGGVIQSVVSGLICLILALWLEPFKVQWSGQFVFALFWMCVVVSLGAISFLYILLRKGESHKVASIFYLIPSVTAIISYFVFKSTLDLIQIVGMLITTVGVALVNLKFDNIRQYLVLLR